MKFKVGDIVVKIRGQYIDMRFEITEVGKANGAIKINNTTGFMWEQEKEYFWREDYFRPVSKLEKAMK